MENSLKNAQQQNATHEQPFNQDPCIIQYISDSNSLRNDLVLENRTRGSRILRRQYIIKKERDKFLRFFFVLVAKSMDDAEVIAFDELLNGEISN